MTKSQLEAYRRRIADLFSKASDARSKILAQNEAARQVMLRVGKGDRTVVRSEVKERRGVLIPRDIPLDMYPNRSRRRRYIDTRAPHVTQRSVQPLPELSETPMFVGNLRASDIHGRGGRAERSDKIMRDALKDYANRSGRA